MMKSIHSKFRAAPRAVKTRGIGESSNGFFLLSPNFGSGLLLAKLVLISDI